MFWRQKWRNGYQNVFTHHIHLSSTLVFVFDHTGHLKQERLHLLLNVRLHYESGTFACSLSFFLNLPLFSSPFASDTWLWDLPPGSIVLNQPSVSFKAHYSSSSDSLTPRSTSGPSLSPTLSLSQPPRHRCHITAFFYFIPFFALCFDILPAQINRHHQISRPCR